MGFRPACPWASKRLVSLYVIFETHLEPVMFSAKASLFLILVCLSVAPISGQLGLKASSLPSVSSSQPIFLVFPPCPRVSAGHRVLSNIVSPRFRQLTVLCIPPLCVLRVLHMSALPSLCPCLLPLLFIHATPALSIASAHRLSSLLLPLDLGHAVAS